MDLQNNSQEYASVVFSVTPVATATVEASVDLVTWVPVTVTNGVGMVLLRGPNCLANQGLLLTVSSQLWIRVTNYPEVVVRSAGKVNLY